MSNAVAVQPKNQIEVMAERLGVEPQEMHNIVVNTVMPAKVQVSNEQFVSFLAVANEYSLNPMTKEIYAFPAKGGGIQPIVSIDGWLKLRNEHEDYDGSTITFSETRIRQNGKDVPEWCKVQIFHKTKQHPTEVVEYMEECYRNTDPWKQKPRRMLQHKAMIQATRYAFGMSGITDQDEAERAQEIELNPMGEKQTSEPTNIRSRLKGKAQAKPKAKDKKAQEKPPIDVNPDTGEVMKPNPFIEDWCNAIKGCDTKIDLQELGDQLKNDKNLSDADKALIRPVFANRQKQLGA